MWVIGLCTDKISSAPDLKISQPAKESEGFSRHFTTRPRKQSRAIGYLLQRHAWRVSLVINQPFNTFKFWFLMINILRLSDGCGERDGFSLIISGLVIKELLINTVCRETWKESHRCHSLKTFTTFWHSVGFPKFSANQTTNSGTCNFIGTGYFDFSTSWTQILLSIGWAVGKPTKIITNVTEGKNTAHWPPKWS